MSWQPPTRPDVQGGTHAPGPEHYSHPLLRAHGRALAEGATRMFEARWPAVMARYGERGRQHTYEDNYWHLSTLDTALRLESPAMFLEYVQWLRTMLLARGLEEAVIAANFTYLREALAPLGADAPMLAMLDQAIALFPPEAR